MIFVLNSPTGQKLCRADTSFGAFRIFARMLPVETLRQSSIEKLEGRADTVQVRPEIATGYDSAANRMDAFGLDLEVLK